MLKNPIPEPMVQLLEFTVRLARFVVIGAWGYLALALIALPLAHSPSAGPAGGGLVEAFDNSGSALVGLVIALTIVYLIAARILQGERARQDVI